MDSTKRIEVGDFVEFRMEPHPDSPLPQGGTVRGRVEFTGSNGWPFFPMEVYVKAAGGVIQVDRNKVTKVPCLFVGDTL